MAKNTVIISVLADAKQFTKGLSDAGKEASGLGGFIKGMGAAVAVGLAAAGAAATALVASSIKAAKEAEVVYAQTAAAIKSTSSAAGRSSGDLEQLGVKLSKISGIDDVLIQKGENVLLTFTNIKGTTFDHATQSALDMSVALGTDMTTSAMQLGKALNDPTAGVAKLTKVGVTFTQQQKDQIAAMQKAGDVAGAQSIILAELDKEFGGSAAAFGQTFEGSVARAKTALGRLQVSFGSAFLPVATQVFSKVSGLLDGVADSPAFAKILTGITGFVGALAEGKNPLAQFSGQLAPLLSFLSPLGLVLKVLNPLLPTLAGGAAKIALALVPLLQSLVPIAANFLAMGASIATTLLPIVGTLTDLLVGTLVPALTGLASFIKDNAKFLTVLAVAVGVVVVAFKAYKIAMEVATALSYGMAGATYAAGTAGTIVSGITKTWAAAQWLVNAAMTANPIGIVIALVAALVAGIIWVATQTTFFQDAWAAMCDFIPKALEATGKWIADIWGKITGFASTAFGVLADLFFKFVPLGIVIKNWGAIVGFLAGLWSSIISGVSGMVGGVLGFFGSLPGKILSALGSLAGMLGDVGRNMIQGLINGATGMLGNLSSFVSNLVGKYIVNPVKNLLGIHSPSTVFRDIGGYTMDGLEIGLRDTSGVRSAVNSLGKELASTTLPAPRVSSNATRESAAALAPVTHSPISEMSASDRAFFRELFQEFAGSLSINDGVIERAASAASARLVKAGVR